MPHVRLNDRIGMRKMWDHMPFRNARFDFRIGSWEPTVNPNELASWDTEDKTIGSLFTFKSRTLKPVSPRLFCRVWTGAYRTRPALRGSTSALLTAYRKLKALTWDRLKGIWTIFPTSESPAIIVYCASLLCRNPSEVYQSPIVLLGSIPTMRAWAEPVSTSGMI